MEVNGDADFSSEDEADDLKYSCMDGYVPLCQDEEGEGVGEQQLTISSTVDDEDEDENMDDDDDAYDDDDDTVDDGPNDCSVRDELNDTAEANGACTAVHVEAESSQSNSKSEKEDEKEEAMSQAQADLIRSTMARFTLPPSVTPDWAKLIPEEVWKSQLQSGLTNRRVPVMHKAKKSREKTDRS